MRFHTTPEYQARLATHKAAYAEHDRIVERDGDHTAEAEAAGEVEYAALHAFLIAPAYTPTEIAGKMAVMADRLVDAGWTDWYPGIMAQIERDLREQQRPCVSPSMRSAFETWAAARIASCNAGDDLSEAVAGESSAFSALINTPCSAPGDFIIKTYVNLIDEDGSTYRVASDTRPCSVGFPFEIESVIMRTADRSGHDDQYAAAARTDLDNCDLGACLLELGRVDFEAAAFVAAADRVGIFVHLVMEADGTERLWSSLPDAIPATDQDVERVERVQRLLTGNGGGMGKERATLVAAYLREHRRNRVARLAELAA